MGLNIENQTKIEADFSQLEEIYARAQQLKLLPEEYQLELCLCGQDFIAEQNKAFRGLEQKTDVLAFELNRNYGSLLICLEYLKGRSGKQGLAQDLYSVFAHGICHLAGYDHLTLELKQKMEAQEATLLQVGQ